jgi:hypothetical protein
MMYDRNDRSRSLVGGNVNGAMRGGSGGYRLRRAQRGAIDRSVPAAPEERSGGLCRLIEVDRPLPSRRGNTRRQLTRASAVLEARMSAPNWFTSFTSITTSDNELAWHSKGPSVHVIHGPEAPAHKRS